MSPVAVGTSRDKPAPKVRLELTAALYRHGCRSAVQVATAFRLSKKTRRITRRNMMFPHGNRVGPGDNPSYALEEHRTESRSDKAGKYFVATADGSRKGVSEKVASM